jgi:hypothetical protein
MATKRKSTQAKSTSKGKTAKGKSSPSRSKSTRAKAPKPQEDVRGSGIYPASGPFPSGEAEAHGMASWGQGEQGAAGYEDQGESEIWFDESELKEAERRRIIEISMEVVGVDGERVGQVKEVRGDEFLVQRVLGRDVYVPFDACQEISETQVILKVTANMVDSQGWTYPELLSLPFSTP